MAATTGCAVPCRGYIFQGESFSILNVKTAVEVVFKLNRAGRKERQYASVQAYSAMNSKSPKEPARMF